jgi:hypothetical protein
MEARATTILAGAGSPRTVAENVQRRALKAPPFVYWFTGATRIALPGKRSNPVYLVVRRLRGFRVPLQRALAGFRSAGFDA